MTSWQRSLLVGAMTLGTLALAGPALAAPAPVATPTPVTPPVGPVMPKGTLHIDIGGAGVKPSTSVMVILGLTVLSVAPALLIMCTSFTKVVVVLSLTRNALGTQTVPPNQVLVGLALFISLFIMSPVLGAMNHDGLQPYLKHQKTQSQAYHDGIAPLRDFMLKETRKPELALFEKAGNQKPAAKPTDVAMTSLVPAFVLSELKSAFIIGFVVFIPFLVIDVVVSSVLMSMGMMMMPPVMVSLPFKLLLFVMVDGWALVTKALLASYGG